MNRFHKILSFVRWRIILFRYIGTLRNFNLYEFLRPRVLSDSLENAELEKKGFVIGKPISGQLTREINALISSRIAAAKKKAQGHTFVNLLEEGDLTADNPLMKFVFSEEILDRASNYFGGKVSLYAIQVLYSFKHEEELRESQLWHKDFGDNKTLHTISYLNDIDTIEGGPFVFIDRQSSKKIKWSPFIRRIPDDQFIKELEDKNLIIHALGKSGHTIHVDPSHCYHCGSRCKIPRLALFISFNTSTPFVGASKFVKSNIENLRSIAKLIRPDLPEKFINTLIK
jgi:hypothetical protein